MSSNVIVKPKNELVPVEVLTKALVGCAAFGFATVDGEDILQGKENLSPDIPAEEQVQSMDDAQKQYMDQYMVFWFSKEPVTGESLQPFSVLSVPQDTPEGEIDVDKIVAFLVGDFKEKLKKDNPHTGEFWAHTEDAKPKLRDLIDTCIATNPEGEFDYTDFQAMWGDKHKEVLDKAFINKDNCIIMLLGNGECEIYGEKEAGEGHSEQNYWIHTLLEEPRAVSKPGVIKLAKVKAKTTTASVPIVPQATPTKVEGQKLITPTGTLQTVKLKPGSNFNGTHEMTKNWYRLVNSLKDSRGLGVVPDQFIKTKTYVAVDVDKRIAECGATSMKDLSLFVHGLRAKEREGTSEDKPEVTKVDRSISTRIVSADEKQKLKQDWLPMAKSGRYPAEIQADEKEAPTFKDITGVTMEDIKKMPFSAFVDLAKYPTASATLIHDLLHRPYGTVHGTVGTDTSKPTAPVSNPNTGKVKIKSTKAA